jgi:hypothetical protein
MGTTPTFGFPYPESSDPPDGPAQMQSLAESIDSTIVTRDVVRAAQVGASFDANGHYTWTHGLGFTPAAVTVTPEVGQAFNGAVTVMVRDDSNLPTQVIFKAYTPAGPFTQPMVLHVIAVGTF